MLRACPRKTAMNRLLTASVLLALAAPAVAAGSSPLSFEWNARLRHEAVDDDAFARDAEATMLRLRAGLRWRIAPGWEAFAEGEGVAAPGDDYNSGANGRTAYPSVVDPEGAELNQAWLRWQGGKANATLGRQRLLLDNQRWVGNVGWRQNEQTFDALVLGAKPAAPVALTYAWLDRVHRVSGDDAIDPLARERDLDAHLLNAAWTRGDHRLVGYAYAVEDQDLAAASTRTLGLRYALAPKAGTRRFGITAEFARQVDHAGNPLDFSHDYRLLEPALALPGMTLRAGQELLGGTGTHALQTPLATLHAFNGWADKFLVTPAAGLDDRYVAANGQLAKSRALGALEWTLAWHDYRADAGDMRYGREWNASLAMPFGPQWKALAKVADYRADRFARDTTKLWLQLEWSGVRP
ncbi:hypothetical protein EYQ95_22900 [Lysobacter sp. N42]|nr:hypothetical protein EYQ95_22900 [Lysobacter sp. N42]